MNSLFSHTHRSKTLLPASFILFQKDNASPQAPAATPLE
jgi:hypothetical protein